jgi:large subunit ribosomal protein L15
VRRIPKRGFHNQWGAKVAIINVGDLNSFDSGAEVTPERLAETGLVKGRYDVLKVLSQGDLSKKLRISAHRFSQAALEKIQKAGGEAVILPGPAPVVKNKQKQ